MAEVDEILTRLDRKKDRKRMERRCGSLRGTRIGSGSEVFWGVATSVWSMNWAKMTASMLRPRGSYLGGCGEVARMLDSVRADGRCVFAGRALE